MGIPAAGPMAASEKEEVMASMHPFVDGFNEGDTKAAAAACADPTSILDEFPPYEWHGAGACSRWMSEFGEDAKKNEITDGAVTLGKPSHVDVAGDRADEVRFLVRYLLGYAEYQKRVRHRLVPFVWSSRVEFSEGGRRCSFGHSWLVSWAAA